MQAATGTACWSAPKKQSFAVLILGGGVLLSLDEPQGVRVGAVLGLKATINPMMVTGRNLQWGGDRGGER
jgi:hypothetical protein